MVRVGLFETMEHQNESQGKTVRERSGPGPTLYLLEWIGERGYCVIREAGNPLAGGQDFDLSCLVKVDR